MKTLKESILGNIEDTIKNSDNLLSGEAEFKRIKKLIANEANWTIKSNSEYISVRSFEVSAPFLCNALGLNDVNTLVIKGTKFKYQSSFRVSVIFKNPDDNIFIERPHFNISCSGRTSGGVIKAAKTLFKDFDTFKTYALKNIERPT